MFKREQQELYDGNKNEKNRVYPCENEKKTMEKSWAYCSRKKLQNIINMTLDNVIFLDTREKKESAKHWIKAFCHANLCTYSMREKTFHSVFPQLKENLFIQFLCYFYVLSWDRFIFSMMLEKTFRYCCHISWMFFHFFQRPKLFSTQFPSFSASETKWQLLKIKFQIVFI